MRGTVLAWASWLDTVLAGVTVTAGTIGQANTVVMWGTVQAGASWFDTALVGATVTVVLTGLGLVGTVPRAYGPSRATGWCVLGSRQLGLGQAAPTLHLKRWPWRVMWARYRSDSAVVQVEPKEWSPFL